jgi:fructose-bisphosphate aldolase/2-amino-3,7-dideoxy-D-threo-hept-6-ulosonate synthase
MIGKQIRIERIMDRNTGKAVIIPMDHGMTLGQIDGLLNMTETVAEVSDGGANAIILHKGLVRPGHRRKGRDIGLIIHLSAGTSMNPDPNDKVLICSVEEAVSLGADAVSIHINLGAPQESKMIESAGMVVRDCNRWGIPLLAMIYPRGKGIDPNDPRHVGHAVRVAEELGADLVKTNYTGDPESFAKIVKASSIPVLMQAERKERTWTVQDHLRCCPLCKIAGVCMGRNAFQRDNVAKFVSNISQVVHQGVRPEAI